MVEVLVALVVLSIGMLGIAALYVETMRTNRTAITRTQAVALVTDMADRIRANPRARAAYESASYGAGPAFRGCATGMNCSAALLAEDDLAWWIQTVQATMPGGNPVATVVYTVGPGGGAPDRYTINVAWTEVGAGGVANADNYNYQTNVELIP